MWDTYYEQVYRGFGCGVGNEGDTILKFASSYDFTYSKMCLKRGINHIQRRIKLHWSKMSLY